MNNLREIWGNRFGHYMTELQKYMRYIFTGHLVIVLMFTIGAIGYAYSEWLKEVPSEFPAALITAILIGGVLAYSPPVTLLKPADTVYFLPLETRLGEYINRALRWSFFSQLPLPFILLIIALPLLSATETGSKLVYLGIAAFIILLKMLFVQIEYNFGHVEEGQGIWGDRAIRFLFAAAILYFALENYPLILPIIAIILALYARYWKRRRMAKPFPYEYFLTVEQNRMMRFYRFANYFTDVPHVKGSVSRRGWLRPFFGTAQFGRTSPQQYLVKRTMFRTDDIFWLWLRLTLISVGGVVLIPYPIVVAIFVGALAFASAVQLIFALRGGDDFRMDMLFPEKENARPRAIKKAVHNVQGIQAVLVTVAALIMHGLSVTPFAMGMVVFIISATTIGLTKGEREID